MSLSIPKTPRITNRPVYEKKILPYIGKNLIKVFVGQRRVGKSYLLFQTIQFIQKEFDQPNIIYINKEDVDFEHIRDYRQLVDYAEAQKEKGAMNYLFIDEVQDIEHFEKGLRHFQTDIQWDVYCTGSNARMLSGDLATFLSGRYIEIKIYSLSYSEFLLFHQKENDPENFLKYSKYGGLPYLINLELTDRVVFDYLKNIYAAILFKDVTARYDVRNVAFLERLSLYVADNIGNIVSAKKISEYIKSQNQRISVNIVLDYLQYLCDAFFIFKVPRNDIKGKRILEVGEKYYMEDLGIRHALRNYRENDIAQLFENLVYVHLRIWDYEVTVGKLYDREIDFVCDRNGVRLYIQVCLSLADEHIRKREYRNLEAIPDNHRKVVVTGDEYVTENVKGIETWNIRRFLVEFGES